MIAVRAGALLRYWRARTRPHEPLPSPDTDEKWRRAARSRSESALAIALALALWDSRFHVVPSDGGVWRGMSGPPARPAPRPSLAAGLAVAVADADALRARWRDAAARPRPGRARRSFPSTPATPCPCSRCRGRCWPSWWRGAIALALARRMRGRGASGPRARGRSSSWPPSSFDAALATRDARGRRSAGRRAPLPPDGAEPLERRRPRPHRRFRGRANIRASTRARLSRAHLGEQPARDGLFDPFAGPRAAHPARLRRWAAIAARSSSSARWPPWPACSCIASCAPRSDERGGRDHLGALHVHAARAHLRRHHLSGDAGHPGHRVLPLDRRAGGRAGGRPWARPRPRGPWPGSIRSSCRWARWDSPSRCCGPAPRACARRRSRCSRRMVAGVLVVLPRAVRHRRRSTPPSDPPTSTCGACRATWLALFFDRQFGLFAFAPVWLMALPGAVLLLRARPADAIRALALASVPDRRRRRLRGLVGRSGAARALPRARACPRSRSPPPPPSARAGRWPPCSGPAASCSSVWPRRRRGSCTTARTARACCCGTWPPAWTSTRSCPRSSNAAPGRALLTLTLLAALALAWRFRLPRPCRGGGGVPRRGRGPARPAARRSAARHRRHRRPLGRRGSWAGPMGPPRCAAWPCPSSCSAGPGCSAPGEYRNSRRTGLPPGAYRVELRASRRPAGALPHARRDLRGRAAARARRSSPTPSRAPCSRCCCRRARASSRSPPSGEAGRARLDEARVVPEALVPRSRRGRLSVSAARHRRSAIASAARSCARPALDRSEPEDGGFRLDGAAGAASWSTARRRRPRAWRSRRTAERAGDELRWGGRRRAAGRAGMSVGPSCCRWPKARTWAARASCRCEVRAPGAWVRFSADEAR